MMTFAYWLIPAQDGTPDGGYFIQSYGGPEGVEVRIMQDFDPNTEVLPYTPEAAIAAAEAEIAMWRQWALDLGY